jgi:hypothetical protein
MNVAIAADTPRSATARATIDGAEWVAVGAASTSSPAARTAVAGLLAALGLGLITLADDLSRQGVSGADLPFWTGLLHSSTFEIRRISSRRVMH